MNTQQDTPRASATLRTINDLLSTLDRMREDGASAELRLQFLLENGPKRAGAQDVDLDAMLRRIRGLEVLTSSVDEMRTAWRTGPLDGPAQDAGIALIKHLAALVEERRDFEGHSEIEMLSRLWNTAPDIRFVFPDLTAWKGPVPRPLFASPPVLEQRPTLPRGQTAEDDLVKVEAEIERLATEASDANLEKVEFDPDPSPSITADADIPSIRGGDESRGDLLVEKPEGEKPEDADGRSPSIRGKDEHEEAPAWPLVVQAWTEALDEHMATHWKFDGTDHRGDETTLRWSRPDDEASTVLVLRPQEGKILVMLRILAPRQDGIERASTTVDLVDIGTLHADPSPFVKTLRPG